MGSSGVHVDSYEHECMCSVEDEFGNVCDFDGEVEVFYDPEVYSLWWTCPLCGYEHEEELEN